jgi:hypothetical protein
MLKLLDRLGTLLALATILGLALGRIPDDARVAMETVNQLLGGLAVLVLAALLALAVHLARNQSRPPYE